MSIWTPLGVTQNNETAAFGYVLFNLDKGLNVHSQKIKTFKSNFGEKTNKGIKNLLRWINKSLAKTLFNLGISFC